MHKHLGWILIALAALLSGSVQANVGAGAGVGTDEVGGILGGTAGTSSALLIDVGNKMLINTGDVLLIHN